MKKQFTISVFLFLWTTIILAQSEAMWLRYPAISPDGNTIVFSYQGDLWKTSSSGGEAVPMTLHEGHDFQPVWSNDGTQIAFASHRYGNYDIFLMPSTGGKATRLTYHSSNDFPSSFSPDDQTVLFTSGRLDAATTVSYTHLTLPTTPYV